MTKARFRFNSGPHVRVYRSDVDVDSDLYGELRVDQCEIQRSKIHATTGRYFGTYLERSAVHDSSLTGGLQISRSSIFHTNCMGDGMIQIQDSHIYKAQLRGVVDMTAAIIDEDCWIENATILHTSIPKGARIGAGIWTRPPLVFLIEDFEYVTEGKIGLAYIGCKVHRIEQWLEDADKLARRMHLTDRQKSQIIEALQEIERSQSK